MESSFIPEVRAKPMGRGSSRKARPWVVECKWQRPWMGGKAGWHKWKAYASEDVAKEAAARFSNRYSFIDFRVVEQKP